jgi:predicted ArsR family transcriptional regulator
VPDDFASQVAGIGALVEPARRALYLYVAAQPGAVSRDQAAAGVGLPRHAAKFHLDKLVDEGLLETEFRRLSNRQGPGAGRPSKLYRRSGRQVTVTLPERRYDLAGQILARALEDAGEGRPVGESLHRAAADAGRTLAATALATKARARPTATARTSSLASIAEVLAALGYEPRISSDAVVLANCPFHALARDHTQLVCGMNLAVITALVVEFGHDDITVSLEPGPDRCCVRLRSSC